MTTTTNGLVTAHEATSTAVSTSAELRFGEIRFPLTAAAGQELTLGRRSETRVDAPDIDLADLPQGRTVSRRHARLYERDGEWILRVETETLNPTAVDGESVPPGLEVPLEHGQTLQIAGVSLQFYQPESAVQLVDDDQIQLDLEPGRVNVEPGGAVTAGIRVINFTDHVDQFIVEVRRLPPTWYSLSYQGAVARRAEIGLFQTQARIAPASDAQARLQILFHPPRDCQSTDGEHPFTIRVTTRSSPRQRREVSGALVILPFQNVELSKGMARTRSTHGEYSWLVRNTGNARTSIDLQATATDVTGTGMFAQLPPRFGGPSASEQRLAFTWQTPELLLEPCGAERARLEVAVRRRHWLGDPLQYHFRVTATSGAATASDESYIECPPRISTAVQAIGRWIVARLPFLVVVAAILAFLWVFFQPPDIVGYTAIPNDIVAGQQVTLTWTVKHATFFTLLNSNFESKRVGFFDQLNETPGQFTATPEETTQYILTAQNTLGLTTSNDQVVVVHPRPHIQLFTVTPVTIGREGDAVELDWRVQAAPDRPFTLALRAVSPSGGQSRELSTDPQATQFVDHPVDTETVYELLVGTIQPDSQNNTPPPTETERQRVVLGPPQIATLTASSASIAQGSPVTLAWTGSGYTSLSLRMGADQNDDSQPEIAIDPRVVQVTERPDATTWYTLTATNAAGSVSKRLEVVVTPANVAPPKLDFFLATPASVDEGASTTLSFSAQNADSVLLRDARGRTIFQFDTAGAPSVLQSIDIVPDQTLTYALTLVNAGGQLTQAVTVQVNQATPTPMPTPEPVPTNATPAPTPG